ncbi:hypothetical protein CU669_12265 [Paramagnetospirillum kuznetsovii]|uniref:Uncharacterized protein n=1 Tax=Paramagnetospirillum kuznetsovii TaxID=2053833 RepID=A0A364NXU5_9PROT|nr:hypothetical protein [Paramagnetospirillum kuznetsovii]RAU21737.1 hypothetical protein CU669_12265 [Paramagnetospirillum kuznetsovii]
MGAESAAPAVETDTAMLMREPGGKRCRGVAGVAVRALIDLLDESAHDGAVTMDVVRRIANAVLSARGPLSEYYANWESGCDSAFTLRRIERQRTDFIGRIITQPFATLLDDPDSGIERKNLAQFFAAVRMIIGEEPFEKLRTRANEAAERHRTPECMVAWEDFYRDFDVLNIFETVAVAIARSFRRFEPRKDWFLIIMNSSPSSVSTASNAFIPKKAEDKLTREFNEAQMSRLLLALFSEFRLEAFTPERKAAFMERWGSEPEKVFGPLFVSLLSMAPVGS